MVSSCLALVTKRMPGSLILLPNERWMLSFALEVGISFSLSLTPKTFWILEIVSAWKPNQPPSICFCKCSKECPLAPFMWFWATTTWICGTVGLYPAWYDPSRFSHFQRTDFNWPRTWEATRFSCTKKWKCRPYEADLASSSLTYTLPYFASVILLSCCLFLTLLVSSAFSPPQHHNQEEIVSTLENMKAETEEAIAFGHLSITGAKLNNTAQLYTGFLEVKHFSNFKVSFLKNLPVDSIKSDHVYF